MLGALVRGEGPGAPLRSPRRPIEQGADPLRPRHPRRPMRPPVLRRERRQGAPVRRRGEAALAARRGNNGGPSGCPSRTGDGAGDSSELRHARSRRRHALPPRRGFSAIRVILGEYDGRIPCWAFVFAGETARCTR